jgi:ATP-binding cassette subfamily B protein
MLTALYYYWVGKITVGDVVMVQGYLAQMFRQLWDLGKNIRQVYEHCANANEMTEKLIEPHEVVDAPGVSVLKVPVGQVEFRNVNFHYHHETPMLEDFSLTIPAGKRVALIGPSGGGKTTLVRILLRLVDIQSGAILVDGQNIASVTQNSLREQVTMVPQEPILFHRSLRDNIAYGKSDATEDEIVTAAKAAHCHEFISELPDGYDTLVGERGVKLSGGQRQRVAIAMAILRNSPILILDEATASLDSESEGLIQDALKNLMRGKTSIVIAHRLSTTRHADAIVVLEKGKIIEIGRHHELLTIKDGIYQKLWNIQVGGFEATTIPVAALATN